MKKAVNNLTDAPLTMGGVEIKAKSQRIVRESLISDDEKKAIQETGAILTISLDKISVVMKSENDGKDENVTATFDDVAYPIELIKNDGTLNGQPALKAKIDELQEKYKETILNDVDFKEKYPDADIEAHRVEVGA